MFLEIPILVDAVALPALIYNLGLTVADVADIQPGYADHLNHIAHTYLEALEEYVEDGQPLGVVVPPDNAEEVLGAINALGDIAFANDLDEIGMGLLDLSDQLAGDLSRGLHDCAEMNIETRVARQLLAWCKADQPLRTLTDTQVLALGDYVLAGLDTQLSR